MIPTCWQLSNIQGAWSPLLPLLRLPSKERDSGGGLLSQLPWSFVLRLGLSDDNEMQINFPSSQ